MSATPSPFFSSTSGPSIKINEITESILVQYDPRRFSEHQVLTQLFEYWRFGQSEISAFFDSLSPRLQSQLCQLAPTSKTPSRQPWSVVTDLPGHLRVSHHCVERFPAVVSRLETILVGLEGVIRYRFSVPTSSLLVVYDVQRLNQNAIVRILESSLDELLKELGPDRLHAVALPLESSTLRLAFSSVTMGVAVASMFAPLLGAAALIGTVLAASPIVASAAKSLTAEKRLRVDVLDSIVVILAVAYRQAVPAAFMVWAVDASYALLNASSQASRRTLTDLFGRPTQTTRRLLPDGSDEMCDVGELQRGTIIVVRSGESLPVDGVVVGGQAMIDQSALTGEHAPVERAAGEPVLAMTVVLTNKLHVRVDRTGEETNAAQMIQFLEKAAEHEVQLQLATEKFADQMVTPTLAMSTVGYFAIGRGAMLAVMNADFGTGIRIAGPLAMLTSLSAAADRGMLIKEGKFLEHLVDVDAIVFDKTGTLTEEVPKVKAVTSLHSSFGEERLLQCIAGAEQRFSHPIARAIISEAERRKLQLPEFSDSDCQLGLGIKVQLEERPFCVGSQRYIETENVSVCEALARLEKIHARGNTAILASWDGHLAGFVELEVGPRPDALRVVEWLKNERGINEIHLVSGDHEAPTQALADRLGIDHYTAEMKPQNKARYIADLQERGRTVAMIGDGVNDTAGLSQADCSISMRGAASAATDIADVVFLDGGLSQFEVLFNIADNLKLNNQRSLALAIVPNSVLIAGAMLGYFGLGASLAFNNAFVLAAAVNGLRAQGSLAVKEPVSTTD